MSAHRVVAAKYSTQTLRKRRRVGRHGIRTLGDGHCNGVWQGIVDCHALGLGLVSYVRGLDDGVQYAEVASFKFKRKFIRTGDL